MKVERSGNGLVTNSSGICTEKVNKTTKTPQSGKEAFECRHKRGNVTQETEMPLRRSNPFKSELPKISHHI